MRYLNQIVSAMSLVSLSLSATSAMAANRGIPLKNLEGATVVTLSKLSYNRLAVHKNVSCWTTYQKGKEVFEDCSDSQGYQNYSRTIDHGWNKTNSSCTLVIEEPNSKVDNDVGMFKVLVGSFFESNIKMDAGIGLALNVDETEIGSDAILLKATASDSKKLYIKCLDPEATSADIEYDLFGIITLRDLRAKAPVVAPSPSASPSSIVTPEPSSSPSGIATPEPSSMPSDYATPEPSSSPSGEPTSEPTYSPSGSPTEAPSDMVGRN